MSEAKPKYVTFRDLHAVTPKPADKSTPPPDLLVVTQELPVPDNTTTAVDKKNASSTSISSSTSIPSTTSTPEDNTPTSTSITSTTSAAPNKESSSLNKKKPTSQIKAAAKHPSPDPDATAPSKDFQRVPNSVVRHALSEGIFRGKSKQVWDYFWSVSRGSIIPVRQVRKSRREIQKGAGLGSMVTVDAAIQHLEEVGLIKVVQAVGSLHGNTYEVFTPEEINPRYTSSTSTARYTSPTQKLVVLDVPLSSISSTTQTVGNTGTYSPLNTFFNTDDEKNDDTHTLEQFLVTIREAAREVCGGVLNQSEQEKARWKELGELLAAELKTAAARAGTVSSPPAFFTAHLRRAFKNQRQQSPNKIEGAENSRQDRRAAQTPVEIIAESSSGESKAESGFSFEQRRRYAVNQQPPLGNGWMVESATGKYDEVINAWLSEQNDSRGEAGFDARACPDCHGTGMYYPDGYEKGAAKCRHERLATSE